MNSVQRQLTDWQESLRAAVQLGKLGIQKLEDEYVENANKARERLAADERSLKEVTEALEKLNG